MRASGSEDEFVVVADNVPISASDDHTGHVFVGSHVDSDFELTADTTYEYALSFKGGDDRDDDDQETVTTGGSFTTLPLPSAPSVVRFGFGSCSMKSRHANYELSGFSRVLSLSPSFLLFLGDLIYADVPLSGIGFGAQEDQYRAHYRRTFGDEHLKKMGRVIPTFFQYDDHEILNDVIDIEHPSFETAIRSWKEVS